MYSLFNVRLGATVVDIASRFPFSRNVYLSPCASLLWQCHILVVVHFVPLSAVNSSKTDNPLRKIFWKEAVDM